MSAVAEELQMLQDAFVGVFRPAAIPRLFGSVPLGLQGLSDNNPGVQWNTWINFKSGGAYVGVNLEGMKYDGWPVARLIGRELENPKLFETIARLQEPNEIELIWWRDAWGPGGSRIPSFKEHIIAPTPTPLSGLTEEGWTQALREARDCLNADREYQGRAKQRITLRDGHQVERWVWVSPHLQFRRRLWQHAPTDSNAWATAMQRARGHLQPLYEFVAERCA